MFAALASAGTLYLPAYPASVLVFDEGKGQIVDRIPLSTGTPMSIRLSGDHKTIYVTTIDHNGIEVIDVATRKVTNHFELNTPTKQFRMFTGVADPEGKMFYAVTKEITKFPDHFEVGQPKYTLIDLAQQKIVKTVDIPKEEMPQNEGDFGAGQMDVSPTASICTSLPTRSAFWTLPISRWWITSTFRGPMRPAWRTCISAGTWI